MAETFEQVIHRAATLGAALLMGWFNLSPVKKGSIGETGDLASEGQLINALLISKCPPLSKDMEERIRGALLKRLHDPEWDSPPDRIFREVRLRSDYGPDTDPTREFGKECAIPDRQWPFKSSFTISVSQQGSTMSANIVSQLGYGSDRRIFTWIPESLGGGWLVGPDPRPEYLEVVVEAVRNHRVPGVMILP